MISRVLHYCIVRFISVNPTSHRRPQSHLEKRVAVVVRHTGGERRAQRERSSCRTMHIGFTTPASVAYSLSKSSIVNATRRRPFRLSRVHPRACIGATNSNEPEANDSTTSPPPPHDDELARKASGTFVGRILIEVGAFIAGVTLLVVVALWKACTVVANYLWRAILWLARVRRLGRWACARAYSIGVGLWRSPKRYGAPALRRVSDLFASLAARFRDADVHVTQVRRVDEHALEVQHMREELVRMREIIERQADNKSSSENSQQPQPQPQSTQSASPASPASPPSPPPYRLILLRHAKSEFDRSGRTADHERALSPAGATEAALVGAELARRGWYYDSVLCSNARRTTETFDRIGSIGADTKTIEDLSDVVVTESLYFAVSGEEMATVVDGELPEGHSRLVVGHSPGINQLVERLTGHATIMGTACAALLEFRGELPPKNLTRSDGLWTLVDVVCPKQLQD